ncbi:SWIM zinc finger domain containing [Micractinium conductrix]|uniref:SWIM zinc finger domain containing n=1 Tax=Micractinium conductrix TaxID=554055 RepID=A0A2P6VI91_9CHLO|nr:SWIM zinc finger domain containing [Micractinium conductrix]|eukprot:PSC73813.1 SWIM zinc finger domain containing [Micractinium conductrix]
MPGLQFCSRCVEHLLTGQFKGPAYKTCIACQPTCVTIARPDKLTFSTEEDFQAHVAACEDDANADLLQDKSDGMGSKKRLYMEGSHKNGCSWRLNASTGMDGSITATQSGAHATDGDCPCGSMAHARRLSPATKDWIANLLDLCVSKDRIYEFCLHPERMPKGFPRPPPGEGPRWVPTWPQLGSLEQRHRAAARLDPDDQAAVAKFIAEHGALPPGEAHTVYTAGAADVLYHQEFICKCYGDNSGTKKCQQKGCQPFMLVIQSPWQRTMVRQLAATGHLDCVGMDATFQVTRYRWGLHALVGPDTFGEAVPLAYCITSSETWEPITKFLDVVKGANPQLSPRVIVIDKSNTEIRAIKQSVLGRSAEIRICFFHIMQAWQRYLKRSEHGLTSEQQATILRLVRAVKLASTKKKYEKQMTQLQNLLKAEKATALLSSLKSEWHTGDMRNYWCNAFRKQRTRQPFSMDTNNLIERLWQTLKYMALKGKSNKRMDFLLATLLGSMATFFTARQAEKSSGRRANWRLFESIAQHEAAAVMLQLAGSLEVVDPETGAAQVQSSSDPAVMYEVSLQHAHCSCPDSTGLLCKHIRAVARVLGGLEAWGLAVDSLREESAVEVGAAEAAAEAGAMDAPPPAMLLSWAV